MQSTKILTDPRDDPIFRANMAAAIRQYGPNGLRVLRSGQDICSGYGRILPTASLQQLRRAPVFCDSCGRVLITETNPLLPLFTIRFA